MAIILYLGFTIGLINISNFEKLSPSDLNKKNAPSCKKRILNF